MRGLVLALGLVACGGGGSDGDVPTLTVHEGDESCPPDSVADWDTVGQPLLSTWCTPCHTSHLIEGERQGAPVGLDFDTYEASALQVEGILSASVNSTRMPPAGGMSDEDREALGEWIACGAPGVPEVVEVDPCAELLYAAEAGPDLCAAGNAVSGDVSVSDELDLSCLCAVDGDLDLSTVSGDVELPLLQTVGGAVRIHGSMAFGVHLSSLQSASAVEITGNPVLRNVDLGELGSTDGDVRIEGNALLTEVHADFVTHVGGDISVRSNASLHTVNLARLNALEGSLVLQDLPVLEHVLNLDAVHEVGGDVVIEDNPLLWNMGELTRMGSLGGSLRVVNNDGLHQFVGLTDTTSVGGDLAILDNKSMQLISVGRVLETVGGELRIENNDSLQNIDGMDKLHSVGGSLTVYGNNWLTILREFPELTSTGGINIGSNLGLVTVVGFPSLVDVHGSVQLTDLPSARDTAPFEFTEISGDFVLAGLPITGISFVPHLQSVGSLSVISNASLANLGGLATLRTVENTVLIGGNAKLLDITTLAQLTHVGGDLIVTNNIRLPTAQVTAGAAYLEPVVVGEIIYYGNAP